MMGQRLSDEERKEIAAQIVKSSEIMALLEHAQWADGEIAWQERLNELRRVVMEKQAERIRELEVALGRILDTHVTQGCTLCPCGACNIARAALHSEPITK